MTEAFQFEPFTIRTANGTSYVYDKFARCILIIESDERQELESEIRNWVEQKNLDDEGEWMSATQYSPSTGAWRDLSVPADSFGQGQ